MKNSSIENRFCMSLVAFAVIVRLLLVTGAAAAVDEAFGRAPQAQAPEPDILTLEILAAPEPIVPPEPQPEAEPEPASEPEPGPTYTPPVFSAEEADGIRIAGACSYTPDKQTLLLQPSSLDFQQDGPTVLIVHTHSSEAYTMEAGFEYPESDELRTQDSRYSVIRIGDEIAQILQDAGIEVLHDTEPNDYPNYNGAYERMRQTIEGYLAAYPTIQMVLDLHRDAAEDAGGVPVALTAYPDGEACAELMLVVGTDEGGLSHPDWQENLANALKLQALLNRSAPGLCRDLDLRTERFNQHETPGSLLVEVGASGNTLAEALRSARILGNALVKLIRGEAEKIRDIESKLTMIEKKYPEAAQESLDGAMSVPADGSMNISGDTSMLPDNGSMQKFPSFEGKDLDGNDVTSDELFSGSAVTVVNFWFTTCGPCVGELGELEALSKELAEKGGSLIGINSFTLDGDEAAISDAKDVLMKKGATYQNVYFASDSEAGMFTANIFAYPTTYVVDRSGNIVGDPIVGAVTSKAQMETLQKLIDQTLAADMG